jgi:hypothetical protein
MMMTKPIKGNLCALGVGLAMLPALANVAWGAPASNSAANQAVSAVTSQLAPGKTIATATPQQLAKAVKEALRANPTQAKAIVQAVFSQLGGKDGSKALAVIAAVQSVVSAGDLAGLVRAAVEALSTQSAGASSLSVRALIGTLITEEASALAPTEASAIANAVHFLLSSAGDGPAPLSFQGPGGGSNPANFSNSGGSVISPSS